MHGNAKKKNSLSNAAGGRRTHTQVEATRAIRAGGVYINETKIFKIGQELTTEANKKMKLGDK